VSNLRRVRLAAPVVFTTLDPQVEDCVAPLAMRTGQAIFGTGYSSGS
jgi:hypothetical protein